MRAPVSLVLITRNAGAQLRASLDSARFADEVVVVDSGSDDDTVQIAASFGARVIVQPWLGFGRQKQFAIEHASHDWVLCLDADEALTPELAAAIRAVFASSVPEAGPAAYTLARRNRFLGRWLAHGEGYPDWTLRLFDRTHAGWSNDEVHEAVLTTVEVGRLTGDLLHDSAEDIGTYLAKQNRYTSLHAEALFKQGIRAGYSRLFLSPLARFLKFYFLRAGFLDGGPGFAHIVIGCCNTFQKYLKLIELGRGEK
jgi:glycosyltransferase involved in cell wall biosynthesis